MNKRFFILAALVVVTLMLSALVTAQEDQTPFLGIGVESSTDGNGALITAVQPQSPAALAGLEEGDVITSVNGSDVTADDIAGAIQALSVGDTITLSVLRDGESLELQAELAARPAQPDVNAQVFPMGNRPYLGVALEDVDGNITISEVDAASPAAEAGLQANDVLVSINGTTVENTRAAIEAIRSLEAGDTVTLEVQRGDETLTLEATLGSMFEQGQFMMPGGAEILDIVVYNYEAGAWQVFGLADENLLAEAGLQQGDVITLIDGETYDPPALEDYLSELADDAQVTLTIERNGETQDITVPTSALDSLMTFDFRFSPEFGDGRGGRDILPESMLMGGARLGVGFEMVDEGARITEIVPDSPAAEAGLQVDDVVTAVNDEAVDEEHTLRDRMFAYEPGDTVTLAVTRSSETLSIDITLEEFSLGEMLPFGDNRGFFDMIPRPFGRDGRMPDVPEQPAQPSV